MKHPHRRSFLATATAAAALVATACGGPAPTTFDLTAPRAGLRALGRGGRAIIVAEPTAVFALDSERIVVRTANGEISYLPRAQWADRLPRLLQSRMIQTFENQGRAAVGRPTDRISASIQLLTDIRSFEIREAGRDAFIEVAIKLVNNTSGAVSGARLFSASSPVSSIDGGGATQALDQALARVLSDITAWAGAAA